MAVIPAALTPTLAAARVAVADADNRRVLVFTLAGVVVVHTLNGTAANGLGRLGQLLSDVAVHVGAGEVVAVDPPSHRGLVS